jgi:hypothetical protein
MTITDWPVNAGCNVTFSPATEQVCTVAVKAPYSELQPLFAKVVCFFRWRLTPDPTPGIRLGSCAVGQAALTHQQSASYIACTSVNRRSNSFFTTP